MTPKYDLVERKPYDISNAERPVRRPIRSRVVTAGARQYTAFDAHSLLDFESTIDRARPGHPLG